MYTPSGSLCFTPELKKKCTSVFCVNVWLLLRWKPVMFLQTARGQNNYQITPIRANPCFHDRIGGCLCNGRYKRGRKRGGKKTPNKKEKGWRRKKDMKLQGRETGPRWCVWPEQSGSDSSSGHFRGFHPKIFLVLFAILQELETCTSSNGTFIFIFLFFRKGLHVLYSWTKFCTNHQAIFFSRLGERTRCRLTAKQTLKVMGVLSLSFFIATCVNPTVIIVCWLKRTFCSLVSLQIHALAKKKKSIKIK